MGLRLRPKITLAMLALLLIPIAIVTLVLVRINLWRLQIQAGEYRHAVAEVVIAQVSGTLSEARTELSGLGRILLRPGLDAPAMLKLASEHLLATRLVHSVGIYAPSGPLATVVRSDAARRFPKPPNRLDASTIPIAASEGVVYHGVRQDESGRQYLPLVVAVNDPKTKKLRFLLYTTLALTNLNGWLSELSYKRFDAQRHNIFLVDSRSRIIAHGDPARVGSVATAIAAQKFRLQKNRAYSLEIERDGERYLTAVLPIVELGWGVVVQQRQRDAYAAIRNTWLTGLGAGAGLAVMALILGFIFGGRFSKPVLELARAASQVANGKFDTRVTVTTGDEIGEMAGAFNQMADDLRTYREKVIEETRIRTDLSRYLGPDVVEQIVSRRESLKLGGERRIVTVMFADVVAFTPLAEKVNPERIVGILNELFTFVTEIIFKHGGIIDKFIGDCVMAVFGTPTRHDDDPTRCVRAAEEIMQWLAVGNAKWKQELGSELQIAIGVNTGEVIAGNIGSEKRMEYTVIGDAVNIASRLESMAQPGQILISRTTAELLDPEEFEFAHLGAFNLVGRTATTDVYRLAEE